MKNGFKGHKRPGSAYVNLSVRKIGEGRKAMLDQFKAFNVETADNLDELVAMSAFGQSLKAEFESQKIAVPEYVGDSLTAIKREIERRVSDRRAARVRELKAQEAGLKTAAEKREEIRKELAALGEAV